MKILGIQKLKDFSTRRHALETIKEVLPNKREIPNGNLDLTKE